ncbi:MAG TPA: TolC family protein [Sphingomicrobium sp.]|nr:TolC family protein [Sphingomicrobium sp.]
MRYSALAVVAAFALGLAVPGAAQERAPAQPVLTLEEAVSRATADQPAILAYEREAAASEEAAVAAQTLPDPQLTAGIENFPIRGENAFSPADDMMTMYTIGVMREQVRRSKREAEAERIRAEALASRLQAGAQERHIRRAVMIAWIDAVEARAKQRLLERLIADLRAGRKVIEAGIPTGSSTAALALQTDAEIGLMEAQLADAKRAEKGARAELARWLGQAAYRPLPDALPAIDVPLAMIPHIAAHPEVQVALAEEEVAKRQTAVAREERKPDISWSLSLGIRPKHGEMVSAGVSIPLQINRRQRQDRLVGEAVARADAARLRAEDAKRELERAYRAAVADYEGADAEVRRIERESVPALEAAFSAAEARYAAGSGTLDQPFAIVRRYVEVTIQSVDARARRARAAAEILHVHGETGR